jgi:SAM-dependent methyltransferase
MAGTATFDKRVNEYEQWFVDHPLAYVSELRAVRELLPSGKGLEIGAGTGRFAAPLGIRQGVEPSRAMGRVAERRGVSVVHGVAENLPFEGGAVDFCLMVTTVCFLDDLDRAFSEVYRVLKPGGAFIIGFVDRESPLGREYQQRKDRSPFYQEATFYSAEEIVSRMKQAGFGDFAFRQTLFRPLAELAEPEAVKEGYGEGSFVVVRGSKEARSISGRRDSGGRGR